MPCGGAQWMALDTAPDTHVPIPCGCVTRHPMYPDHDITLPPEYRVPRPRSSRARAEVDARTCGMTCLNGLAEMWRQLFQARQSRAADVLMDRCSREALEKLLRESSAFLGSRVRYA